MNQTKINIKFDIYIAFLRPSTEHSNFIWLFVNFIIEMIQVFEFLTRIRILNCFHIIRARSKHIVQLSYHCQILSYRALYDTSQLSLNNQNYIQLVIHCIINVRIAACQRYISDE